MSEKNDGVLRILSHHVQSAETRRKPCNFLSNGNIQPRDVTVHILSTNMDKSIHFQLSTIRSK